jgi:two-component system, NtrC family, response regulator AtoC
MHNVLVVDDEPIEASVLGDILTDRGFDVRIHTDPVDALAEARKQCFDLVVSDLRMPQMDGLELLGELHKIDPKLTVIMITAYATVDTAVLAMREGAFDYVTKPFSKARFLLTVDRAIKNLEMTRESVQLKTELEVNLGHTPTQLVGTSPAMQEVCRLVSKVAQDDKATVLLEGETGTGKDLVARMIHQTSPRADAPLIVVNCASIPEGLMESEFFGHEKGAFTGASTAKAGKFELADRGTLFLDEVAEMNAHMQSKLLRVLQTREFERVGGTRTHRVNVRIIAATNKKLSEEVRGGRFREDLFYRLNVLPMTLPPLRQRKEDIPPLTECFLRNFQSQGKRAVQISPAAMEALMNYDYPGNVRELENMLERALILCDGRNIAPGDLHIYGSDSSNPPFRNNSFKEAVGIAKQETEREFLLDALRKSQWNRVQAAKQLGIDYKTLRRKIQQYALSPSREDLP